MYIKRRWALAKHLDKIRFLPYAQRMSYLLRTGWTNIPLIMIGIPVTIISTAGLLYIAQKVGAHGPHKYHSELLIYRPGDPRIGVIPARSPFDP